MINWWLIVVAAVACFLTFGVAVYLVFIFVADADRGGAYFPKAVSVLGIALSSFTVLLVPFDVAARVDPTSVEQLSKGINLDIMWIVCLSLALFFVLILIPFATFYYEAHDPEQFSAVQQILPALLYTTIFVIIFGGITVLLWITVGQAVIPYKAYQVAADFTDPLNATLLSSTSYESRDYTLDVSLFIYVVATISALGWILFCVYGGVGLVALPFDMFKEWFVLNPNLRPPTEDEYRAELEVLAGEALQLQKTGKQLSARQRENNTQSVQRKINYFRTKVFALQKRQRELKASYEDVDFFYVKLIAKFIVGIFASGFSVLWVIHTVVYTLFKWHPFLNDVLIALDKVFALFGTITYAALAFYLLWCAVKGCIKVGMRIVFFQIHPMRLGDTLMNSMLFNTGLVLLTSVTVAQFSAMSFTAYAANTVADTLLNVYVRRLKGIGLIITYLPGALVIIAALSTLWVVCCPVSKEEPDAEDDE